MTYLVVDASVAVKWFLREVHAGAAMRILDPNHELIAPDLIWAEFGTVLWKRRRRGEITLATARAILLDFKRYPIATMPVAPLLEAALEIADGIRQSVYDSLYLALAERRECRLVTADRRFRDAVMDSALAAHMLWVAEAP